MAKGTELPGGALRFAYPGYNATRPVKRSASLRPPRPFAD